MNDYSLFYKENKDRLYAYLLRMTGERQLALDFLHESFARHLGRYGRREYNKALLYTIGRNAALDVFPRHSAVGFDAENYKDSGTDPEQQIMVQEKFKQMMSGTAKLAPFDRELISLVTTTDLTYREIGRLLKISEANVKVRIHGARTRLRGMAPIGNSGYWELRLELPFGEHRFAYILDGTKQITDPTLPVREKDDFGFENCIYEPHL